MSAPKYCAQCGYQIIEEGQPAGFCSEGCAEVHTKLHDMDFERAQREAAAGNLDRGISDQGAKQ